jgi:hypothetical protein
MTKAQVSKYQLELEGRGETLKTGAEKTVTEYTLGSSMAVHLSLIRGLNVAVLLLSWLV